MKKLIVLKTKENLLLLFALFFMLSACQKENSQDISISSEIQKELKTKIFHVVNEDSEAKLSVSTDNLHLLESLKPEDIKFVPIYKIAEETVQQNEERSRPADLTKQEADHIINIKLLDVNIPNRALGYSIAIEKEGNANSQMATDYIYSVTAGNMRKASVAISGTYGYIEQTYANCQLSGGAQGPYYRGAVASGGIKHLPELYADLYYNDVDVRYNKIAVNYDTPVIVFYKEGTCEANSGCQTSSDNPARVGGGSQNTSLPPSTLGEMSAFMASDLQHTVRALISNYIQNADEFNALFSKNAKVKNAINIFLDENEVFLMNAFANDETIVEDKHIASMANLLETINSNTSNKNIQQQVNFLKATLPEFLGMELKTALKKLDQKEMP